ncbi:MAG: hypothetical protein J6S53_04710 [Lentisphaeria bacterium]|nr:hypothetical protein [Lentisphaeria bacterium]
MSETSFRKRSLYILSFLLFWAFLASCHVFYYSVWKKEKYLTESRKKGWKEYHIPPLRGALKDKNNAVILQTRVRYDLVVTRVHSSLEARKKRRKTLKRLYPSFLFEMPPEALKKGLKLNPEGLYYGMTLKKDLSADEVIFYAEQEKKERDFTVKMALNREVAVKNLPEKVLQKLGAVLPDENGCLRGVSGMEKEYELLLGGKGGKVAVMLDKYGFWVTETIRGTLPENGKDLILPVSIDELLQGKDFSLPDKKAGGKDNGSK